MIVAAVSALAVAALGTALIGTHHQARPLAVESPAPASPGAEALLAPASPGAGVADYVGSRWRLTAVTDSRGSTDIPPSVDAWLHLAADGRFVASDGINTTSGHFITTSAGFDILDAAVTAVGYVGDELAQSAANAGIRAVANPDGNVTVLSADHEKLTVQAGGMRLTWVRTEPLGR